MGQLIAIAMAEPEDTAIFGTTQISNGPLNLTGTSGLSTLLVGGSANGGKFELFGFDWHNRQSIFRKSPRAVCVSRFSAHLWPANSGAYRQPESANLQCRWQL